MKKKIWIGVICGVVALIIGITIGFFKGDKNTEIETIENSEIITYFSNIEQTEKFSIHIPQEHNKDIFVSLNTANMDTQNYRFKHVGSGETLFILMVYKKGVEPTGDNIEKLKETDDFVYYWWQSNENANIADETIKEEFVEMQRYYKAIKNSFEVKTMKKEGE